MAFDVHRAAEALIEARRRRVPLAMPAEQPPDASAAYAVQEKVAAALGSAAGWKVGRGTAAPFCADHLRMSPCHWPAADFLRPAVEVEIAFQIARDLGRGGTAPSEEELRGAIGSVHAAIEIADSRFDTWPVPDRLWALADHQSSGALVVDPDGVPWSGQPLDRARVSLVIDGESAFDGEGSNAGGEPFDLLGQLVAHCAKGGGLAAGSYVTTGSLTGMIFVEPGAVVAADIEGIGRVSLELTR